jgi:predicted lipid-binding transport protein (Tim44 family)
MKRRAPTLIALVALVALVAAPDALAAAGGGSSGFGGGGGGGRGAGLYILIQILIRIAIFGHGIGALVLIGLIVLALLFTRLAPRVQSVWASQQTQGPAARRRTQRRERRVELAAAEAAEDDPAFSPDVVRPAAAGLFKEIEAAWDAADLTRLQRLVAPELLHEWEVRLADFQRRGWRNRVEVVDEPVVEYVGLTHHGDRARDSVVVRIQARLRDVVQDAYGNVIKRRGRLGEIVTMREFWTLRRDQMGRWLLASIEQGAEGGHALEDQIVATPWADERGMRDEALVEGAVAEALPEGTTVAEVAKVDFRGEARAAALDLSLADGRFSPDVLEVAARRAVAAWARAVDGGKEQLSQIAAPAAIAELLHPGDPGQRTRLVVRGPEVKEIHITGLDAASHPPSMTVELKVEGCRYLEDRQTAAVLSGSRDRRTSFSERWTFALDGDTDQPWRISAVGSPP